MRLFAMTCLLLFSAQTACAGQEAGSTSSIYTRGELSFEVHKGVPVYRGGDPNVRFYPVLLPNELAFDRVVEGQDLALNSVVVMPRLTDGGSLTIEFRRSDLQEAFVRRFFFDSDPKILKRHPFAREGIEAILTDERLILNLYPGVSLHLRNDMEYAADFETFINSHVTGKVSSVEGEVFYSDDHEYIIIKLKGFYTTATLGAVTSAPGSDPGRLAIRQNPDGGYEAVVPPGGYKGPARYPPRIMSDP